MAVTPPLTLRLGGTVIRVASSSVRLSLLYHHSSNTSTNPSPAPVGFTCSRPNTPRIIVGATTARHPTVFLVLHTRQVAVQTGVSYFVNNSPRLFDKVTFIKYNLAMFAIIYVQSYFIERN